MPRPLWSLVIALAFAPAVLAQDLARQPTAFTAWLDFKGRSHDLPIWVERAEIEPIQTDPGQNSKTVYRIRFRRFAGLVDEVMLRVYFDDTKGAQPVLSVWSEIGTQVMPAQELGQGLGMPSSQTVRIPMSGVDYVDIDTPGDAGAVKGVLAVALRKTETREALDFGGTPEITDPFGATAPTLTGSDDLLLFGRVKATLEPGVIPLNSGDGSSNLAVFDFPLAQPPLIALLTFEISNADISSPPQLSVNGKDAGDVNVTVTDLADPALTGATEAARPDTVYHYAGWLKCQKVIPGSLLSAGTNEIIIATPPSLPVAIRAVEVQLKYTQDASTP